MFIKLSQIYPSKFKLLRNAMTKLEASYIKHKPDVIIINSLKQITGENMTYIDNFIFFNIPGSMDEYL